MSKYISPLVLISWLMVLALLIAALFSPLVAPHNPVRERLLDRLLPPTWAKDGEWHYVLGTDHLGRDVVSRIIYGSRVSLIVGFTAMLVGGSLGIALGVTAGYVGGRCDDVVMVLADMQLALPTILEAVRKLMSNKSIS